MMTFQERLENAYPSETYGNTLRALREGIASADDTIRGTPIFASKVGDNYRGLIRRAGHPPPFRRDVQSRRSAI